MKTSTDRILTTHTGSLPRPSDLVEALNAKELGRDYNDDALSRRVKRAVTEIVRRQADVGLDVTTLPFYYGLDEGAWRHWCRVWDVDYDWMQSRFISN